MKRERLSAVDLLDEEVLPRLSVETVYAAVNLKGSVQYSTETSRTTNRNGEERKIETVSVTAGTFVLTATCANKGAPQEPKKSAGK